MFDPPEIIVAFDEVPVLHARDEYRVRAVHEQAIKFLLALFEFASCQT